MLLKIQRYIDLMFEADSRPSKRTVERWLAADQIPHPVVRFGKRVFIDVPDDQLPDGTRPDDTGE